MASFTELLQIVITADSKGAVAGLGAVGKEAGLLDPKIGLLQKNWDKFTQALATPAGAITATIGSIVLLGGAAFKMAENFAQTTESVRSFQLVTGASAEDASKLVFAAKELGVSAEGMGTAFGMAAKKIGNGTVDLSKWNVETAHTKDGGVDMVKTFLNIADAFNAIHGAEQKAAFAAEIFGKGWKTVVPLLNEGREGLKKFFDEAQRTHQIFSQEDIDQGHRFTLAMREVDATLEGLKLEIGQAIVPAMADMAQGLAVLVQGADQLAQISPFKGFMGGGGGGIAGLLSPLAAIGVAFGDDSQQASKMAQAITNSGTAADRAASLYLSGEQGTKKWHLAIVEAATAQSQQKAATDAVQAAIDRYNSKTQTAAEKTVELANKTWGLIDAQLALQGANLGVEHAMENYNQVMADGTSTDLQRRDAEYQLETAIMSAAKAAADKAAAELGPNATAAETARAKTQAQIDVLTFLAGTVTGPVQAAILGYIAQLKSIPPAVSTTVDVNTSAALAKLAELQARLGALNVNAGFGTITPEGVMASRGYVRGLDGNWYHRAAGGPVLPGRGYIVGEHGPEFFSPGQPGMITPNHAMGSSYNITVNAGMGANGGQIGRQIVEIIKKYENQNGTGWRN